MMFSRSQTHQHGIDISKRLLMIPRKDKLMKEVIFLTHVRIIRDDASRLTDALMAAADMQ